MRSKLSDHQLKKGKFITPINSIPSMQELSDEKSWTYGRMPEYIWIGLICEAAVCELLAGAVHAESGWQAREL